MSRRMSSVQISRRIVLGIFLAGLVLMVVLHQKAQGIPSIDALDPFGGVETLLKFVAGGELVKKIEPGTLVLFAGSTALALVLSRFFCGWICPFGALQGLFGALGKKLFGRRFTVPPKLDKVLRYAKYLVLAAIVFFTWRAGELVIRPYDPLAAAAHLPAGISAIWAEFAVGLILLAASMILSMLYERAFCKYLCPLGALNSLLGRLSRLTILRKKETCISCSLCDRACPMNIDVSKAEALSSPECIQCMECVTSCPTKPASLSLSFFKKPLKLRTVVLLGLGIYLGAAAVGHAFGVLDFVAPTLAEKAQAGGLKIEDIKGSSTWASIADSFGVELERLYRESGLGAARPAPEAMIKDAKLLPGLEGFEADTVRFAVSRILGIPYAGEGGAAESAPAAPEAPAAEAPSARDAMIVASDTKIVGAAPAASNTKIVGAAPAASDTKIVGAAPVLLVPADFVLEGTMSLRELAAALGASEELVLAKLELPAGLPRDKPLRDLKDAYGYTMPVLKERLAK